VDQADSSNLQPEERRSAPPFGVVVGNEEKRGAVVREGGAVVKTEERGKVWR
jgi:photosystem II stability/assembly factor-like uncharacterized protein